MTHLVAVHCMLVFGFFGFFNFDQLLIFHAVVSAHSYDVESTLTSIQDDGRLLYTNDVKYLDLSLLLSPPFVLHVSKSCRSRCSF